jgi:hypothetical protein
MSIYKDESGRLGQLAWNDQGVDFGDSAHFTGLWVMATGDLFPWVWIDFVDGKGLIVRHPEQEPWNNWRNVSRDQTMPIVAALMRQGSIATAKKVFWAHAKRLFFCQNIERDAKGTRKYPWPHKVNGKWRVFDFADPLAPHHISAMARAAGYKTWLIDAIAFPTFILECLTFRYSDNDDQGALIATAACLGKLHWFKFFNPDWEKKLDLYCNGWRRQGELFKELRNFVFFNRSI